MADRSLTVKIIGDATSLERAFRTSGSSAQTFGKETDGLHERIGSLHSRLTSELIPALIGGGGVVFGLEQVVEAAKKAQESQDSLAVTMKAAGLSYEDHKAQIEAVIRSQSELSAFQSTDLRESYASLIRQSKDAEKASTDLALATDIARGRHIDLATATNIVIKANEGMVGGLKRMGIEIAPVHDAVNALTDSHEKFTTAQKAAAKALDDAATRQKAIAELQKTYAGQAEAYGNSSAGASEKFKVSLTNLEITLGTALLPTLTKGLGKLADFVNRLNDSGEAAHAAKTAVAAVTGVVHDVEPIAKAAAKAFGELSDALGGSKQALEALAGVFVAAKFTGGISSGVSALTGIGTAAGEKGAAGKVSLLLRRLGLLATIGAIGIPIVIKNEKSGATGKTALEDAAIAAALGGAAAGPWGAAIVGGGVGGFDLGRLLGQKVFGGGETLPAAMGAGAAKYPGLWVDAQGNPEQPTGDALKAYIARAAKAAGLDPKAVLAVAAAEGGFAGAVGDGGHAFGPFQQNNAGGVLTGMGSTLANQYAKSPAGINAALAAMAKLAKGLTGMAAVQAIVTGYERPADGGAGDLARARAFLLGSDPFAMADLQGGASTSTPTTPDPTTPSKTLADIIKHGKKMSTAHKKAAAKVVPLHLVSPDVIQGAFATQTASWKAHVRSLVDVATAEKARFESAFGNLANVAMTQFNRNTAKGLTLLKKNFDSTVTRFDLQLAQKQKEIATAQKQLTPEEKALNDFLAGRQSALDKAAKDQREADLAAAISGGDPQAIAQAQDAINQAALDEQQAGLQAAADASRVAADAKAQDALDFAQVEHDLRVQAAQDGYDQDVQNYQDSRDLQAAALQAQLDDLQAHLELRGTTIAEANQAVIDLMRDFGLDPAWFAAGTAAGSALQAGLAAALGSTDSALGAYQQAADVARSAATYAAVPALAVGTTTRIMGGGGGSLYTKIAPGHVIKTPLMAKGGIALRPTLRVIGDDGPEAVIPLSRMGGASKVEVHFVRPVFVGTDLDQVARALAPYLDRLGKL